MASLGFAVAPRRSPSACSDQKKGNHVSTNTSMHTGGHTCAHMSTHMSTYTPTRMSTHTPMHMPARISTRVPTQLSTHGPSPRFGIATKDLRPNVGLCGHSAAFLFFSFSSNPPKIKIAVTVRKGFGLGGRSPAYFRILSSILVCTGVMPELPEKKVTALRPFVWACAVRKLSAKALGHICARALDMPSAMPRQTDTKKS